MEISIVHATKYIKKALILDQVNMNLHGGVIYGLQGPNGSGKTMLMRLISGLVRPSSGQVFVNGKELGKEVDFPPSMGLLLENPAFLPNYTGLRNLEMLAQIQGRISTVQIRQTLSAVGLDPDDPRKFRKFSLGMKQRLGIAAATMEKPELILLDEPTNALDTQGIQQICSLVKAEKERGALIVLSSHDAKILEQMADEVYSVDAGRVEKKEQV